MKLLLMQKENAAMLTAKEGARDPSAIPSICRVSASHQYPSSELSVRKKDMLELSI